jgi:integrase
MGRHTFGTLMAASGADVLKIKHWMGHADIQTSMIYMHYAPAPDECAMVDRAFATTADDAQLTAVADG